MSPCAWWRFSHFMACVWHGLGASIFKQMASQAPSEHQARKQASARAGTSLRFANLHVLAVRKSTHFALCALMARLEGVGYTALCERQASFEQVSGRVPKRAFVPLPLCGAVVLFSELQASLEWVRPCGHTADQANGRLPFRFTLWS